MPIPTARPVARREPLPKKKKAEPPAKRPSATSVPFRKPGTAKRVPEARIKYSAVPRKKIAPRSPSAAGRLLTFILASVKMGLHQLVNTVSRLIRLFPRSSGVHQQTFAQD